MRVFFEFSDDSSASAPYIVGYCYQKQIHEGKQVQKSLLVSIQGAYRLKDIPYNKRCYSYKGNFFSHIFSFHRGGNQQA